ncbi:hypothetical protein ACHAXS_008148 [Conticribra weissflogii]
MSLTKSSFCAGLIPLPILLTVLPQSLKCMVDASYHTLDWNCGTSWMDAFENCHEPCPNGECSQEGWSCFGYTGCASDLSAIEIAKISIAEDLDSAAAYNPTEVDWYCGESWLDATENCRETCATGSCSQTGLICFEKTGCSSKVQSEAASVPTELAEDSSFNDTDTNMDSSSEPPFQVESIVVLSLLGADGSMGENESVVMEETVLNYLDDQMRENSINIKDVVVSGQAANNGRKLTRIWLKGRSHRENSAVRLLRYEQGNGGVEEVKPKLDFNSNGIHSDIERPRPNRYLPTSSSSLDVSLTVTGEYRPPPFQDMDAIVTNSVNRGSSQIMTDLRDRGRQSGSTYFDSVQDLRATSAKDLSPSLLPPPPLPSPLLNQMPVPNDPEEGQIDSNPNNVKEESENNSVIARETSAVNDMEQMSLFIFVFQFVAASLLAF